MERRILLIIGCICFASLTVALIAIGQHPSASGYELSVYESLPPVVWMCLAINTAGGIGIATHQAFAKQQSYHWLLGLCIIIAGNLVTLSLPIMRGYFLYASSDTITHTNWISDVITSGRFGVENRYPIVHLLSAQLAQVCNLPPHLAVKILPILFSIIFTGCSYLLAKVVLPEQSQAILASICATTLFFGYYHVATYPQGLSIMMLPLVFYLYFERNTEPTLSFRALLVLLLLFFPFFHPATAIVLIVCLTGVEIAKAVWNLKKTASKSKVSPFTIEPTLIAWITFFTWISTFGFFGSAIQTTFQWLQGEIERVPRVAEIQSLFASQGLSPLDQSTLALKLYGDNLAFLVLSVVALVVVAHRFLHRQEDVKNLFILSVPFVVTGPVWVLIFVTTLQVTLGRLLGSNAMMWATPVLAGFALHKLFEKIRSIRTMSVASILLCASAIAVLGVYHSPFTLQVSWQITRMDVAGANWFTTHHDPETPFATLGVPPAYVLSRVAIPEHFNYQEQSIFGTSFGKDTYLLLAERFKIASLHPALSSAMINDPRLARPGFTHEDFDRLEHDPSIDRFYTNGEIDFFLVRSTR